MRPLTKEDFTQKLVNLMEKLEPFLKALPEDGAYAETLKELRGCRATFMQDDVAFHKALEEASISWKFTARDNAGLR